MKWYEDLASNGIVISSRVRIARNIEKYPFTPKLSSADRSKMLLDVKSAFMNFGNSDYNFVDVASKEENQRFALVEEHLISKEFASLPQSVERMLVYDNENSFSVMVGEEDHLRIQSIMPGFNIDKAYTVASSVDEMLEKNLRYAYSEKLGYLTCCPSNTGTGIRASVMLHLPMLSRNQYMKSIVEFCSRSGLTVRGFYGEGSASDGELYQISNQLTLGVSEEETISRLKEAVASIVEKERSLRDNLRGADESSFDKLWRSYGILKYTRNISSKEFMSLWSDLMFARDIGLIAELQNKNLVRLLIKCMPYQLILNDAENAADRARDTARARLVREALF